MRTAATLPGSHRGSELLNVLLGQGMRELGFEARELSKVGGEVRQLHRFDRTIVCLLQDEHVHDPDRPGVVEPNKLLSSLTSEVLGIRWKLDDQVVDGSQLIE